MICLPLKRKPGLTLFWNGPEWCASICLDWLSIEHTIVSFPATSRICEVPELFSYKIGLTENKHISGENAFRTPVFS